MARPSKSNQSNSGFVLLQTLWLLLLASLLASTMMATTLSAAKDGEAAGSAFRTEMAAESAFNSALYFILTASSTPAPRQVMQIDGMEVIVATQDLNGLLDLNAADGATLQRLLEALTANDTRKKVSGIISARPITSYAALAAVDGMTQNAFDILIPHVTLFSRQAMPSAETASSWLATTLRLERAAPSVLAGVQSAAGRAFRIEAIAKTRTASSRRLVVEFLVTGRRDQPYWIYEWAWHAL